MKHRFWALAATLVLVLALTCTARAGTEYGLIYDETERLLSDELEALGTEVLPSFPTRYGVDVRVDILTDIGDFTDMGAAAAYLYTEYNYGSRDGKGVSLTLLVDEDIDGVALKDWHIYFGGNDSSWTENAPLCVPDAIYDPLSEDAWAGGLEQDSQALTKAIMLLVKGLESFLGPGGEGQPEILPTTGVTAPGLQSAYVMDTSRILEEEECRALEQQARSVSERYGVGVYIMTVEDYRSYTNGSIRDAADLFYHDYALGLGEDRDGVLLLLSMADRDYHLAAYGAAARTAFTDSGLENLTDFFLDDLGNDDWYTGFADYLTWSADYLDNAENGTPYSESRIPMGRSDIAGGIALRVAVILLVPLLIAGIYIAYLTVGMRSVAAAVEASAYLSGDLRLTRDTDRFTHITQTRRKIETKSSGGRSRSGTSGKF